MDYMEETKKDFSDGIEEREVCLLILLEKKERLLNRIKEYEDAISEMRQVLQILSDSVEQKKNLCVP